MPRTLAQILAESVYISNGKYFLNLSTLKIDCNDIDSALKCGEIPDFTELLATNDSCGNRSINIGLDATLFVPHTFGVFGSMYMEDASINTTVTTAHLYYPVLSGLTSGIVSGVTFQNNRELKIVTAGNYKVDWSMSITCNSSDQTIEGLILAGAAGTAAQLQTVNATRAKENGVVYSVSGSGVISCAAGDIIRLGLENETSGGKVITCNHANLTLVQISG